MRHDPIRPHGWRLRSGLKCLAISTALASLASVGKAQDASAGASVFKRCSACHNVDASKGSSIGPNLYGVYGRKAGSLAGYHYSPAMGASGLTWDAKTLDAYLASPQAVVHGNKMPFGGLPNPKDRSDIAAYLKTLKK